MRILSRVCVEFRDRSGHTLFRIGPHERMVLLDAPEAIRQDPIFNLLIDDGSLEVANSRERQKELEADPVQDADASGKRKAAKTVKGKEAEEKQTLSAGVPETATNGTAQSPAAVKSKTEKP